MIYCILAFILWLGLIILLCRIKSPYEFNDSFFDKMNERMMINGPCLPLIIKDKIKNRFYKILCMLWLLVWAVPAMLVVCIPMFMFVFLSMALDD